MKKKFLSFILAICLLLPCGLALTACGKNPTDPKPHTHSWSSTYSHDIQYHYYTCSGCDEVKDKQEHDFETIGNATCAICYFNLAHEHTAGSKYAYNAQEHWSKCGYCNEEMLETKTFHEYNKDKCVICGYVNPNYVPPTVPVVSRIHDLRVITREYYTLIILPDGKVALIDPCCGDDGINDLTSVTLPYTNDKDGDGLNEIDYLIFTSVYNIPTSGLFWDSVEVVNLYRPNIGINTEEVMFSSYSDEKYFNGQRFTQQELINMPEYLVTGVDVPYYDCMVESYSNSHDYVGRYEIPVLYLAALYYADLNGVNVIPIKPENSITNTFSYMGNEYTYSLDFLDLGIEFNVFDSFFSKMPKKDLDAEEEYYLTMGTSTFNQYVEYNTMITVKYKDFKMLYMSEVSRRAIENFIEKYSPLHVDLFVFACSALYEIGASNIEIFLIDIAEQFTDAIFDENNLENNIMFLNMTFTPQHLSQDLQWYFLQDDSANEPVVTWENYIKPNLIDSNKDNIRTACYRVNRKGEKSLERWYNDSLEQHFDHWDDWW